jgi:hypothetical protein
MYNAMIFPLNPVYHVQNQLFSNLINLNQTWAEESVLSDGISRCEWTAGLGDSRNGETVAEGARIEWEGSIEGNSCAIDLDVLDLLNDRSVLLVDVDQGQRSRVARGPVGGVGSDRERDSLAVNDDIRSSEDAQRCEDRQLDDVGVGAGAWDDEHLVQGREGKLSSAGGQERKSAWEFALKRSVVAILLALLADNCSNTLDEAVVAVLTEKRHHVSERTEDNISEGCCEGDGVFEVANREVVLACLDGSLGEVVKGIIGIQCVKFLLRLNVLESVDDKLAGSAVLDPIALDIICDIAEEFSEEGDFGQLVEGNKL